MTLTVRDLEVGVFAIFRVSRKDSCRCSGLNIGCAIAHSPLCSSSLSAGWMVGLGRVRCRSRTNEARTDNNSPPQATFATRMLRQTVTYGRKGSKRSRSTTDLKTENVERSSFDRPRKRSRVSDEDSSASGDDNSKFSRQNIRRNHI